MDYKEMIGEEVITSDGTYGVITKVENSGEIYIKFYEKWLSGGFLFDPFLAQKVKFVDPEKQKVIDDKINEIESEQKKVVDRCKAKSTDDETFFITVAKDDNPHHENGLSDKVIGLSCSKEDAYIAFHYYISQQVKIMNDYGTFHQIGLYDAKTGKKIAQET